MNYTYILRCGDNSLYTGWTNHLTKRVAYHNAGRGAKYTKAHLPVELVYYEIFDTKDRRIFIPAIFFPEFSEKESEKFPASRKG